MVQKQVESKKTDAKQAGGPIEIRKAARQGSLGGPEGIIVETVFFAKTSADDKKAGNETETTNSKKKADDKMPVYTYTSLDGRTFTLDAIRPNSHSC
ncbi:Uncharacterised protein [uncultured archaeon]|nr:Uncharacterised protein [uncultured archaeon]